MATIDELTLRVIALETLLQNLERRVWHDTVLDIDIPYYYINGARLGVDSDFWCRKNLGEGAGVSIGAADRFGLYVEVDEPRCQTEPTVAVYAACPNPNPFGQANIGVLGVAANAPTCYGGMFTVGPSRNFGLRAEGIELCGEAPGFDAPVLIGTMANHKVIYP